MGEIKQDFVRHLVACSIIVVFAAVVLMRLPDIVWDGGRFWAEEGVVYFKNAWDEPWFISWFAVAADAGYVNLAAGIATWLGLHLGGLLRAPEITVTIALTIQCLPVYLILSHDFPWRRSMVATLAAVILCAVPPVTGEVWLNTITSQFHLALCSALIFAAPAQRGVKTYIDCLILVFAVLSGPATCFLMPLFVLDAVRDRQAGSVVRSVILMLGFAVQIMVFLLHPLAERGSHLGPAALLSMISLHTIVLQFSGLDIARDFAKYLAAAHSAHKVLWAGPLIFISFYGVIGIRILKRWDSALARLWVCCLVFALVSFYEAWGGSFGGLLSVIADQRYAFAPMVLNGLLLTGLASDKLGRMRGLFASAAVIVIVIGATNFRRGTAQFANGPPWRPAVAAWRKDPAHILPVWPGAPWAFSLVPFDEPRAHN